MPLNVFDLLAKNPARYEPTCARMAVPADRHSRRVVKMS